MEDTDVWDLYQNDVDTATDVSQLPTVIPISYLTVSLALLWSCL